MTIFNTMTQICWLVFIVVWIIFSLSAKKNKPGHNELERLLIRFVIIIVIFSLFKIGSFRQIASINFTSSNPFLQGGGVFICAAGIAFAIWARIHIGKNWGMPMSLKERPVLVTSGPYRFVRHPIYTGICFAMLGSMITEGFMWLIWFVLMSGYFIYSAKKEEKSMLLQFPDQYPEYMTRTKMLIPFIF